MNASFERPTSFERHRPDKIIIRVHRVSGEPEAGCPYTHTFINTRRIDGISLATKCNQNNQNPLPSNSVIKNWTTSKYTQDSQSRVDEFYIQLLRSVVY